MMVKRRPPGGSRPCSGSATRRFCSTSPGCSCPQTGALRAAPRWDISISRSGRKTSPELATLVSRYLLADIRSLQAPYIIPNHLAQADPLIARFERWARGNLKEGFSLQEAAGAIATSARTLQRRCEAVLGKSPLSYFQDLRVERAQSLLHGGRLDLDAIAAEVGYVDGATLGTLLRERLGRGVRELRADLR
jgi:transcriptional regulator GlxA family with amidase domain